MLLQFLSLASGVHFTFLAFVLFRRNKLINKSVRILIKLLLFMAFYSSIVFYHYIAVDKGNETLLSFYLPLDSILLAMLAPCLYLYVMATIEVPVSRNRKTVILHSLVFLPFIAFNIYFATLTRLERVDWLMRDFHEGTPENNMLNIVLYVQIVVYLLLCYIHVRRKISQTTNSNKLSASPDLNWLKHYLHINLIYTILSLPVCFYFANEQANIIIGQLAMNIQFGYLFFRITSNTDNTTVEISNRPQTNITYSILNPENSDNELLKLNDYVRENKPYLSELCSIQTLSEQTGIPQYQLTKLINTNLNQTFPDYINQLRIKEVHKLLLTVDTTKHTLESVAHACGFGSKSAFNRAFKKFSQDLTPTEFVRMQKKSDFV